MVRALLREVNPKTQTRRLVFTKTPTLGRGHLYSFKDGVATFGDDIPDDPVPVEERCRYGVPGDRIWVRETFASFSGPGAIARPRDATYVVLQDGTQVYRDGERFPPLKKYAAGAWDHIRWRPSIHMPRWASRLTLEIVLVRVERLNDISEADAKAEGLAALTKDGELIKYGIADRDGLPGDDDDGWHWQDWDKDPLKAYARLWDQINGEGAWAKNPWVWRIEFRRVGAEDHIVSVIGAALSEAEVPRG
jgi:hypothetical protein